MIRNSLQQWHQDCFLPYQNHPSLGGEYMEVHYPERIEFWPLLTCNATTLSYQTGCHALQKIWHSISVDHWQTKLVLVTLSNWCPSYYSDLMWIVTIYIAPLFFSLFTTHTQKRSSTITKYDTFYLSIYTYMRMYHIISKSAVKMFYHSHPNASTCSGSAQRHSSSSMSSASTVFAVFV